MSDGFCSPIIRSLVDFAWPAARPCLSLGRKLAEVLGTELASRRTTAFVSQDGSRGFLPLADQIVREG